MTPEAKKEELDRMKKIRADLWSRDEVTHKQNGPFKDRYEEMFMDHLSIRLERAYLRHIDTDITDPKIMRDN